MDYYPNENNKPQEFVPVPISLWWNVFKKHIKDYEIVSINDILEGMDKTTTDPTKKEIFSEIYTKISDKTKDEMNTNIDKLISELLYLKLYEFLLFIDKFRRGAISYPPNILSYKDKTDVEKTIIGKLPTEEALQYMKDKGVSVSRASYLRHKNLYLRHKEKLERLSSSNKNSVYDELELRTSFKNFNIKIRQKIKKKIKISELFVSPKDKDEIYHIIDNDIKDDSKPEYENFMELFKTQITDTSLMNIVADDVVEYIRFVGREIRFSHFLSPEDYLAPVS